MNPITIPNISIPTIGIPTIGIPSVGFPSASGGGLIWPKGLKESIKAIYDPAKQGMTNYDVIESYAEDFSKFPWNNKKEKYTGTLTPNTLTITNVAVTSALIYTNSKPENFKVYITGIKDNQQVIFGDDTSTYRALIVEKDGVYDVNWEDNHHSYCIWCNFLGDCNITITQLPTSILKDLSGNGNHAYLYGGKGKLNSGMGVYKLDNYTTTKWYYPFKNDITKIKANSFVTNIDFTEQYGMYDVPDNYTFSVSNLDGFKVRSDDGEVEIVGNICTLHLRESATNGGRLIFTCKAGTVITEIPDYPNQLCYDGKMYAVCYGFPILTDYTVIADRTWFDKKGVRCFCSKYKDNTAAALFKFEWVAGNKDYTSSLGKDTNVVFVDSNITWQTKTSYNGKALTNLQYEDGEYLIIGNRYEGDYSTYIGCHGKIIIADRSFTEDEITWLKDNWKKI